jgi:hypothetical protein
MNFRGLFDKWTPAEELSHGEQLARASAIMKKAFPNGPEVRTVKPDKEWSADEIFQGIIAARAEISKSLYS